MRIMCLSVVFSEEHVTGEASGWDQLSFTCEAWAGGVCVRARRGNRCGGPELPWTRIWSPVRRNQTEAHLQVCLAEGPGMTWTLLRWWQNGPCYPLVWCARGNGRGHWGTCQLYVSAWTWSRVLYCLSSRKIGVLQKDGFRGQCSTTFKSEINWTLLANIWDVGFEFRLE